MKIIRRYGWLALLVASTALAQGPGVGDAAPAFTLPDQDGVDHSLSDYLGQKVLLYFYLRDETPGCTKEARDLRDDFARYQNEGIVILGVSYDGVDSHAAFKAKHNLPFTLLSDADKSVSKLYGTQGKYPFASRRSFMIDESGAIIHVIKDVDVTTHSRDVLSAFKAIGANL